MVSLFTVLLVARAFSYLLYARAYIIELYSDVGRKLSINGYNFIFLARAILTLACGTGGLGSWGENDAGA